MMKSTKNGNTPKERKEELQSLFSKSEDLLFKDHHFEQIRITMVFFESMVDIKYLDKFILPKLDLITDDSVLQKMQEYFQVEDLTNMEMEELTSALFTGRVLFFMEGAILSIQAGNLPKRNPEESSLETSIRGPKDGFVEDLNTNISLVRRRLFTPSLCVERYQLGSRSRTKVAVLYLEDIIDERIIKDLQSRLEKIDIDVLVSNQELESLLDDSPYSIFPGFDYTGRPDFIVENLNQGRFAIIMDGSPTVSIAPVNLLLQTKSPEDSNINYFFVSIERLIRIIGLTISGFLPGIWVAFSAYNIEQIPYLLVATISMSRFGLPLSAPIEMFIVLFLFEFFNEAGIRLPRAIGQTVSVLGGLIVGDAAIRAGLTSPTMLVIGAITYISSFTLVNQSLKNGLTTMRFIVLLLSTLFGLFGVILTYIITIIYLASKSSFGVPYLGSVAPLSLTESVRAFIKLPLQFYKERTKSTSPKDSTRKGDE
ncbi:spore germination protein [[Bacillus] enclensis]|uniref:spore germination protein n=1 Tax=[Bacillus] enclensis TaxID=1402860 RepID=UPI001E3593BB|nr:spore germination protein [[Bacillus] enclensis]